MKFDHWLLETEAFRALAPGPRALLVDLSRYYNGHNNGQLRYATRQGSIELHVSKSTVSTWLKELQAKGFIVERQAAAFEWKAGAGKGVAAS